MENNCDLNKMKKGGDIHFQINKYIHQIIKPNMKLFDLANSIEHRINDLTCFNSKNPLDCGIAFPTGLSVNNCVAHWTPTIDCNKLLLEDDVIKIDYGVHFDGSIIDSAFTFCFNEKYNPLLESSKTSTEIAIKLARPDMLLTEIGKEIEENMCSYEIELNNETYKIKPVRTLCGHEINKYKIHGDKIIPNIYLKDYTKRISENEFYAVETFATTGSGLTYEDTNNCSHFMINYKKDIKKCDIPNNCNQIWKFIMKYYNTLAFTDRWIIGKHLIKNNKKELLESKTLHKYLNNMNKTNIINKYPPIYDTEKNSYSAQFEDSIYVGDTKTIILSKPNN